MNKSNMENGTMMFGKNLINMEFLIKNKVSYREKDNRQNVSKTKKGSM